jgi:hypothetical protein
MQVVALHSLVTALAVVVVVVVAVVVAAANHLNGLKSIVLDFEHNEAITQALARLLLSHNLDATNRHSIKIDRGLRL